MSLTQLAVIVVGAWLILSAITVLSTTATLLFGIAVVLLVLFDTPALATTWRRR